MNDNVSRVDRVEDSGGVIVEGLKYLGLDRIVSRTHQFFGTHMTFVKNSGESNGDAGDQYVGLDRFGRVVDLRWARSGTYSDRFLYGHDRNGNRLYKENGVNSAFSELYHANGSSNGYDKLNQLTDFRRGTLNGAKDTIATASRSQSWSLDALGNFNSQTSDGVAQTRGHNKKNRITSISGGTTPTYDDNGNLTRDETGKYFKYDAWNRLVQVKASDNTTVLITYAYDALDRRIIENSGTARDVYFSAQWQVLEERVGGAAQVQYVWSLAYIDGLVERLRDTNADGTLDERLLVLQDANWNVTAIVNSGGNVAERYVYDPYGSRTILTPAWANRATSNYSWDIGHQGAEFEILTGLYHSRFRDLSPTLGRWLEPDPIGFGGGQNNWYAFVGNNPTTWTDFSGLDRYIFWYSSHHMAIAVDTWNWTNDRWVKTGQITIHFAPLKMSDVPTKGGWESFETLLYKSGAFCNFIASVAFVGKGQLTAEKVKKADLPENKITILSTPAQDREMLIKLNDMSKRDLPFSLSKCNCIHFSLKASELGLDSKGAPLPISVSSGTVKDIGSNIFDGQGTLGDVFKYIQGHILLDDNGKPIVKKAK